MRRTFTINVQGHSYNNLLNLRYNISILWRHFYWCLHTSPTNTHSRLRKRAETEFHIYGASSSVIRLKARDSKLTPKHPLPSSTYIIYIIYVALLIFFRSQLKLCWSITCNYFNEASTARTRFMLIIRIACKSNI